MPGQPEQPLPLRIATILAGGLIGFLLVFPFDRLDRGAILVNVAVFIASLFVSVVLITVIHEAGHAIVGRLVGCEVFGVTIGSGRQVFSSSIGSARLDVRLTPSGGATILNLTGIRWRDAAMLIAGLAVQVVAIVVALTWHPDPHWADVFKWTLIAVCGLTLLANLWPGNYDTGPVAGAPTDGGQLLTLLRDPERWRADVRRRHMTRDQARLAQTLQGGDIDGALQLARDLHTREPDDRDIGKTLGTLLLLGGSWREAFDLLAPLVDDDDDFELVNNAAWAAVMSFDPDLLAEANRLSQRALTLRPDEPACQSTRGSALVACGRPAEGRDMLDRARTARLSPQQKAFVVAFIALAEQLLGRPDEARARLAESERLHATCPALAPIRQRITFAPPIAAHRIG